MGWAERKVDTERMDLPPFFDSSAATDTGKIRNNNQDRVVCLEVSSQRELTSLGIDGLYIVADGMGGHSDGEVAAEIAVTKFSERLREELIKEGEKIPEVIKNQGLFRAVGLNRKFMQSVFELVNGDVMAEKKKRENDMATTLLVAVRYQGNKLEIGHIGDCRAYVIKNNSIFRMTNDHTLAGNLAERGEITWGQVRHHHLRSNLTRGLGDEEYKTDYPDIKLLELNLDESLLLCSDGLWDMLEENQIRQIVVSAGSAQEATRKLIEAANAAGGEDNISAIVVKRRVEEELKMVEKVFAAQLEDLVKLEETAGALDVSQLQKHFEGMKSWFPKLPVGGRLRAKVIENVMDQLGAESEKLRKAGKIDEQIFEEWLKRVFIPLYRRAGK